MNQKPRLVRWTRETRHCRLIAHVRKVAITSLLKGRYHSEFLLSMSFE